MGRLNGEFAMDQAKSKGNRVPSKRPFERSFLREYGSLEKIAISSAGASAAYAGWTTIDVAERQYLPGGTTTR